MPLGCRRRRKLLIMQVRGIAEGSAVEKSPAGRRVVSPRASTRSLDRNHRQTAERNCLENSRCPASSKRRLLRLNALWHKPTRPAVALVARQHSGTGAGRVSIAQVGMSGGFCHIVLQLVETGYWATVQRCTDESQPDHRHPANTISTRPMGPTHSLMGGANGAI